ncbi:uncharacterized protein LOC110155989 isoform X2 [Boleophthalmus pectinirostris]|uniref:uncharacterized protein LOC110155989 isoform X2 n=1 Tax=Boleophthalmus pectinirostris TaxID=150288 RepID=UPI00242BEDF4|nr:uncharacterized protein LOC110155989 isoform X2 [Boleophthalmus pectinirostris]
MGLICYNPQNRNILVLIFLTVLVVHSEHITKREGETVILPVNKPNTLKTYVWSYGPKNPTKVIAVVTDNIQTVVNGTRFGTRLDLDISTGNLTVQNLTIKDSGAFLIQILTHNRTLEMQFNLVVTGNTVLIQALEGTNITLPTGMTHLEPEYDIFWTKNNFSGKLIVSWENNIITYDPGLQEHLLLDPQTGAITIINILKCHSGFYCVRLMYNEDLHSMMEYEVQVYSPVSAPHVSFEQNSFDSKEPWSCRVNCSVQNSENVVLKWYRRDKMLNQTSDSDLSSRLVLPLNVPQTKEEVIYSCQAENPISNQTIIFNTSYSCPQKKDLSRSIGVGVSVGLICAVCLYGVVSYRKRFLYHTPSPRDVADDLAEGNTRQHEGMDHFVTNRNTREHEEHGLSCCVYPVPPCTLLWCCRTQRRDTFGSSSSLTALYYISGDCIYLETPPQTTQDHRMNTVMLPNADNSEGK